MTNMITSTQSVMEWKQRILDLYQNRCVVCRSPIVVVHEIVPKSKRPKTWMTEDNCITLCQEHHLLAHRYGYKRYEKQLRQYRDKRRKELGLSECQNHNT